MKKFVMSVSLVAALFVVLGCGQQTAQNSTAVSKNKEVAKGTDKTVPFDPSDEDGGEWCNPHGIAEEECSMCSAKAAKECKAKGDWCDKHDRAKSQCFICDPSLMEKAKLTYKAKYGKEMPAPKKNMPEKK
ncbi:MAG: hypothetical protein ACRC8S_14855 [Fimbriiglobus sp.]